MLDKGMPLDRDMYLALNYGAGEMPDPWTSEHEAELPEAFQDHSKVDPPD